MGLQNQRGHDAISSQFWVCSFVRVCMLLTRGTACLPTYLPVQLSSYLSACLHIYLSIYPSFRLSIVGECSYSLLLCLRFFIHYFLLSNVFLFTLSSLPSYFFFFHLNYSFYPAFISHYLIFLFPSFFVAFLFFLHPFNLSPFGYFQYSHPSFFNSFIPPPSFSLFFLSFLLWLHLPFLRTSFPYCVLPFFT